MPKNTNKPKQNQIKKVKKVIIPAAGWGTRFLPMTKVVHKELVPVLNKPIIHYLAEEAAKAGIEEIILVISPRKLEILKYFTVNAELEHELKIKGKLSLLQEIQGTNNLIKVSISIQNEQLGLGHAIYMAADITQDEPFAVILGDDLIDSPKSAIKQLIDAYEQVGGKSIIGVQSVAKKDLSKYGVVKPLKASERNNKLFEITGAVEKPSPEEAPSDKAILGRYVFTPETMDILKLLKPGKGNEINVVDAFETLSKMQGIYAFEFDGIRYDLGSMEGFVKANIDYALKNPEIKAEIMSYIKKKVNK